MRLFNIGQVVHFARMSSSRFKYGEHLVVLNTSKLEVVNAPYNPERTYYVKSETGVEGWVMDSELSSVLLDTPLPPAAPVNLIAPTGGLKNDTGKPDFTHLSLELLEAVASVREFGAKKYTRNNWKRGFKVTRSLAAVLRHIFAFLSGETNDKESGLSHLAHAVCGLEHAIYDMKHRPENDDREEGTK